MVKFDAVTIDKLEIRFNQPEQEVSMDIPISGGIATLFSKPTSAKFYEVRLEVDGDEKFAFKIEKVITAIGRNNNSTYYALLKGNMERHGITPLYDGKDFDEKFNNFIFNMQLANGDVTEVINNPKWYLGDKEKVKSWAESSGNHEEFPVDITESSLKILKDENFLEYCLDVIENRTVAQRPKSALCLLIALSSILEQPLNSLANSSPGKGKSRITETVFKIFPKQRRFELDNESTVSGIIRMTQFEEGKHIFKGKIIYLGDIGNEKEQSNPKVQELMSLFKVLMSKQSYIKVITDMGSDNLDATVLNLEGCGSVMVETITKKVEAQFQDRSVRWSPDDGKKIRTAIREYQTNELKRIQMEHTFESQRPIAACGIDQIFYEVQKLQKHEYKFQIINPYGEHMLKLFPTEAPTVTSRDINHILEIPKIVTLTNIFNREIYENGKLKITALVVSPEDYVYSLNTVGKSLAYMISPIPENALSYLDMVEQEYVTKQTWPYKHLEYKIGFDNALIEQDVFNDFIKDCKPITAKDMGDLMNVESKTAREYLNDLDSLGAVYKDYDGSKNLYYPVSDFEEVRKTAGVKFVTPAELKPGTTMRNEITKIYEEMLQEMEKKGYKKYRKRTLLG